MLPIQFFCDNQTPLHIAANLIFNTFEHCRVEEEWFPTIRTAINADRFARCAGANGDIGIMPSPEGSTLHPGSLSR